MPKLINFTAQIREMEKNNVIMCECVRKLDEGVQTKANKAALVLLKNEIQDNFVSNIQQKLNEIKMNNVFKRVD